MSSLRAPRARLAALDEPLAQLLKFAGVGGLGTVTNLACFYALVDRGPLAPGAGAVVCFALAVTQNYALNELWTFRSEDSDGLSLGRYLKFVGGSLLGLGVNLAVLIGLLALHTFPLAVIPQGLGIAAGMGVNFAVSRTLVFAARAGGAGAEEQRGDTSGAP